MIIGRRIVVVTVIIIIVSSGVVAGCFLRAVSLCCRRPYAVICMKWTKANRVYDHCKPAQGVCFIDVLRAA